MEPYKSIFRAIFGIELHYRTLLFAYNKKAYSFQIACTINN